MSETDQTAAPNDATPFAVPLVVNVQYVKDLSFENPNAPRSLLAGNAAPEVSVSVDVRAQGLAERTFEVMLTLSAEAKRETERVFVVELTFAGVFTVADSVPEELMRPLLLIEGPRLLFPFARAILAEATRDGGFPPLLINPIDFGDLFRRRQQGADEPAADATT